MKCKVLPTESKIDKIWEEMANEVQIISDFHEGIFKKTLSKYLPPEKTTVQIELEPEEIKENFHMANVSRLHLVVSKALKDAEENK